MPKTLREIAADAVKMVMPMAMVLMKELDRKGFYIVIANPTVKVGLLSLDEWKKEHGILYEQGVGDRSNWHKAYDSIARSKTFVSAREGLSTREIQTLRPYLLIHGDTTYFGSAHSEGLTVAVSGLPPHYDEMIAKMVLAAFHAIHEHGLAERSIDDNGFLLKST